MDTKLDDISEAIGALWAEVKNLGQKIDRADQNALDTSNKAAEHRSAIHKRVEEIADEEAAIRTPILEKYDAEGSPYFSTARLWDDGVIDPAQTRTMLALGLSAAYNAPIPDARFGVFRM